jgi:hypothetical protein
MTLEKKILLFSWVFIFACVAGDKEECKRKESDSDDQLFVATKLFPNASSEVIPNNNIERITDLDKWERELLKKQEELNAREMGQLPMLKVAAEQYINSISDKPAELAALFKVMQPNALLKFLPRFTMLATARKKTIVSRELSDQSVGYAAIAAHNLSCAIIENASNLTADSMSLALAATTNLSSAVRGSNFRLKPDDTEKAAVAATNLATNLIRESTELAAIDAELIQPAMTALTKKLRKTQKKYKAQKRNLKV